ncbi:hypothetical protein KLPPOU148_049 [Klebsiella phage vB_KpnM_15-38_KLPPOU148]|uniref:DUF3310 domain-containing protein n=1 Tax=Klebsiella phage vB_KpnM_15-38_KLPPOU148 TaxID=2686208 RepID=A0A6B9J482_9CAUD|nr:nucleotide kinase [Klebsiella phage vB_KpnM_15-38_KLPPOU148]QGZ13398.1 hypothetical protein KLPPOU148_049 [Klebsiella phage vB_KpnM_15-38_KLPPOU148]
MTQYTYHLGTPEMFAGMSECVTHLFRSKLSSDVWGFNWAELWRQSLSDDWELIAQRERVTGINDDRLLASLNEFPLVSEKYPRHDNINHPLRYTKGDIECIDAIKAATVGKTGIEAVCVANVVKYLWRYEEKNGLEDVKKARWYLERLINELSEGE